MNETADLIQVVQLPVITEQLSQLKEHWEQIAADAESMVATEDTLQQIKSMRSDMRKEFDNVESLRKAVKKAILDPYEKFEAVYKDCVSSPFKRADAALSSKAGAVEGEIKARCEEGLRDYFCELCAVHHLDWLRYEQCGIKVDMASAKAKTPKKLREQIAAFVASVSESVDRINSLEDAEEIREEFQRTLDAAGAICTVKERHRRIEEARAFQEQREAIRQQEAEAVRKVEALAPPVHILRPEESEEDATMCKYIDYLMQSKTVRVSLILHPTRLQYEEKINPILVQLKKVCDMEGIRYE